MVTKHSSWSNLFWAFSLSAFLALVLMIVQVEAIFFFWPDWIALVIIYWALVAPDRIGPFVAFIIGTLLEVLFVRNFGVLGLGLATLAYVVNRAHQQLRVMSMWQQTIFIGALVGIFKLLTGWLYGMITGFVITQEYFYSLVGTMLVWPFVFILLQELRSRARIR